MLSGKLTKLRTFHEDDLASLTFLLNDQETRSQTIESLVPPTTPAMVKKRFEFIDNSNNFHYIIVNHSDQIIGLVEIDALFKDRHCQVSLQILASQLDKGYGSDALKLILDLIFLEMNMNKCTTIIPSFNKAAETLLTKAGFKKEVIMRDHVFRKGAYHDAFIFGLLQEEFLGTI